MTASSSSRRSGCRRFGGGVAAFVLGLLWAATAALAQVANPLDILPTPAPTVEPEAPPPAATDAAPANTVEVDQASTIDAEAVGLIEPAEGGFGRDMWAGAARPLVERLLPALPVAVASAPARSLARRLLLSAATPPQGAVGANLLALRVERLAAMGDSAAVNNFLRAIPADRADAMVQRVRLDSLLLAGDNVGACALARALMSGDDTPYWEQVFIFCQALKGRNDAAVLGVDLLRERVDVPPSFDGLLAALRGEPATGVAGLKRPTALDLAMLRAARVPVPATAAETAPPAVARAIALTASAPLEVRLAAAERAAALGALAPEALAEVYAGVPFTSEDLAAPLSRARVDTGPTARALLYQAARAQGVAAARAEAIRAALDLAKRTGGWWGYVTAARLYEPMLASLAPAPELLWFADSAARGLLAAGDARAARDWLDLAASQAAVDAEAARLVATLWPIAKLADGEGTLAWDDTRLAAWRGTWAAKTGDGSRIAVPKDQATLLYALLAAVEVPVPAEAILPLLDDGLVAWARLPVTPLWRRLDDASRAGRVGETVLLALITLDDGGVGRPAPLAVAAAVTALRRVGLEREARALAVEAALAGGVGG